SQYSRVISNSLHFHATSSSAVACPAFRLSYKYDNILYWITSISSLAIPFHPLKPPAISDWWCLVFIRFYSHQNLNPIPSGLHPLHLVRFSRHLTSHSTQDAVLD